MKVAKIIGADSVTFLTIKDLKACLKQSEKFCYACFDGKYSIPVCEDGVCSAKSLY